MEDTPRAIQEFSDQVKKVEATTGHEAFDEAQFSKGLKVSFSNFVDHISKSPFLEEDEKGQLIHTVDLKASDIIKGVTSKFNQPLQMLDKEESTELALKITLLSKEAGTLINDLMGGVERQLRSKQTGFEGISDGEFHEIMTSLITAEPLPDYTFSSVDSVEEGIDTFQGPARADLLLRCPLGQEVVYMKANTPTTLLFFTVSDPKVNVSVAMEPPPTTTELHQKIADARADLEHTKEADGKAAGSLRQAMGGYTENITPIDTGWNKLSLTQTMAIESAYNMGLDAARSVKMQLLVFKVAKAKGYELPADFKLDGGWGPTSNAALEAILSREGLPFVADNTPQNLKTLMTLHHQVFPGDNTELFLTTDEINDPRYKFENKGVYRGMKVEAVKDRLLKNGFKIEDLTKEKVFGNDITPKVMEAFPKALAVLQKLTTDKNLQASILATMIMESGLSSTADTIGLGRGDRKDYVRYVDQNLPRVAAAFNEYSPMRIETNSAGIMQVNYKTAQVMLHDRLGEYYSKDDLIKKLEGSVELSTVVAFLVYQDNQNNLQKAERLYTSA